jgi:hypothetical protein
MPISPCKAQCQPLEALAPSWAANQRFFSSLAPKGPACFIGAKKIVMDLIIVFKISEEF